MGSYERHLTLVREADRASEAIWLAYTCATPDTPTWRYYSILWSRSINRWIRRRTDYRRARFLARGGTGARYRALMHAHDARRNPTAASEDRKLREAARTQRRRALRPLAEVFARDHAGSLRYLKDV